METARLNTPLTQQLDREWRRLRRRRTTATSITSWRCGDSDLDDRALGALREVRRLDEVLERTHHRHGRTADDVLHWLLGIGHREPLARRLVLQRTMPLVIRGAVPWAQDTDRSAATDEAIACLTVAIGALQLDPGDRHVAPRLASRAIYEAFRKPHRHSRRRAEVAFDPRLLRETPGPAAEAEALVVAARLLDAAASAGLDPDVVDLANRLARGESTAQIAAARACTDRTIRNQRARAFTQLRRVVDRNGIDPDDPDSLLTTQLAPAA